MNELVPPTLPVYEEKLEPPSNYTKKQLWYSRTQYGNILRGLISSQLTQYKREKNRVKKTRIAHNIGYLVQVQATIINQEKNIEERIARLEEIAALPKR